MFGGLFGGGERLPVASGQVTTYGYASPAISGVTGPVTVNYQLIQQSPAELAAMAEAVVRGQAQAFAAQIEALSSRLQLTKSALTNILHILGEGDVAGDMDAAVRRAVAKQHEALDRLRQAAPDDPEVGRLRTEAATLIDVGKDGAADPLLVEAERIDAEALQQLQVATDARARSLADTRRVRALQAEKHLDFAAAAALYMEVAATLPAGPADDAERAEAWLGAAQARIAAGEPTAALPPLSDALALYRRMAATAERAQLGLGDAAFRLAGTLMVLGDWDAAAEALHEATQAFEALPQEAAAWLAAKLGQPEIADLHIGGRDGLLAAQVAATRAALLAARGDVAAAELEAQHACEAIAADLGTDSPALATPLTLRARFAALRGAAAEAEVLAQQALDASGAVPLFRAQALVVLGQLRLGSGRTAEGRQCFADAIAISEEMFGLKHFLAMEARIGLAAALEASGAGAAVEPEVRAILVDAEAQLGADNPALIDLLRAHASLLSQAGRWEEAEAAAGRCLTLIDTHLGPERPESAVPIAILAAIFSATGRPQPALAAAMDATLRLGDTSGDRNPLVAALVLTALAEALLGNEQPVAAIAPASRALVLHARVSAEDSPFIGICSHLLGSALALSGRSEEAVPLVERAYAILHARVQAGHPLLAANAFMLGALRLEAEDYAEAVTLLREAVAGAAALPEEHPLRRNAAALLLQAEAGPPDTAAPEDA